MGNKQPVTEYTLRENIVDGEEDGLDIDVDLESQSSSGEGTGMSVHLCMYFELEGTYTGYRSLTNNMTPDRVPKNRLV